MSNPIWDNKTRFIEDGDNFEVPIKDMTPTNLTQLKSKLSSLISVYNKPYPHSFKFNNNNVGTGATLLIFSNNFKGAAVEKVSKFILTGVRENRSEKFQIFETFGAPVIFFFDEKTKIYNITGVLAEGDHSTGWGLFEKDSESWAGEFRKYWESTLRGTKLVQNKQIAVLSYLDNIIHGYPVNLSVETDANNPFMVSFSFNMIITKHRSQIKKPKYSEIIESLSDNDKNLFLQYMQNVEEYENDLIELNSSLEKIKPGNTEKRKTLENKMAETRNNLSSVVNSLILLINQASAYDR